MSGYFIKMQPEGDIIDNSEVETSEKEIEETGIEEIEEMWSLQ